jgi:hypothetical protein
MCRLDLVVHREPQRLRRGDAGPFAPGRPTPRAGRAAAVPTARPSRPARLSGGVVLSSVCVDGAGAPVGESSFLHSATSTARVRASNLRRPLSPGSSSPSAPPRSICFPLAPRSLARMRSDSAGGSRWERAAPMPRYPPQTRRMARRPGPPTACCARERLREEAVAAPPALAHVPLPPRPPDPQRVRQSRRPPQPRQHRQDSGAGPRPPAEGAGAEGRP